MKKIILILSFLSFFTATEISYAQAVKDSWSFGFGFSYPRFQSTEVRPQEANYGGYLSLQRNFTEHVGLRVLGNYSHMKGRIGGFTPGLNGYYYTNGAPVLSDQEYMHTDIISGSLDLLYYFIPCSPVDPYLGFGLGIASENAVWPGNVVNPNASRNTTSQFNLLLGSEWKISSAWNLKTEFGMHTADAKLDGTNSNNRSGVLGSNAEAYVTFNVGFQYYFSKGAPSKYCDLYNGIEVEAPKQNYPSVDEIESLIEKYIPKEVEKQVVVEKPVKTNANWVLYGINFEVNKASLMPESYPILENAYQILNNNQDLKVEIQGYTDNTGSKELNKKLSEERANVVKNYLIKKGISGDRLTAVGLGESNPVGNNATPIGRAENRRIEFKVIK